MTPMLPYALGILATVALMALFAWGEAGTDKD